MTKKFSASHISGGRIVPSRTQKNDADFQLRIDAGELIGTMRNVVLQVNTQAKNTGLRDWVKKNTSHGQLAKASFDTAAADHEIESQRVLDELEEQAKENI